MLKALLSAGSGEAAEALLNQLGLIVGVRNQPKEIDETVGSLLKANEARRFSVVSGLGAGLRRRGKTLTSVKLEPKGGGEMLADMLDKALESAMDSKVPVGMRIEAIDLVGFYAFDRVGETLGRLLDAHEPPSVHRSVSAISTPIPTIMFVLRQ